MTKRNNQYERFLNQDMVDRKLTRLAGQITNLRKGNVETVELISGENLLPPVDPVERYLETKKLNELKELNIPIQQAIEKIQSEVSGLRPAIENSVPAIEAPPAEVIRNVPLSYPWLTEERKQILESEGLYPDMLYIQERYDREYESERQKTIDINEELGHRYNRRNATKEQIAEKNKLRDLIKKYRTALDNRKNILMGSGLAVSKTDLGAKAPNAQGAKTPRRTKYAACPVLDQMIERARVLIGEINAGNTSVELRNELSRILLPLYKNKRISKEEYRRFATM